MTKKSSAKIEYERYNDFLDKFKEKLDVGMASFLLKLPIPMSYEIWWYLHTIKGDV